MRHEGRIKNREIEFLQHRELQGLKIEEATQTVRDMEIQTGSMF